MRLVSCFESSLADSAPEGEMSPQNGHVFIRRHCRCLTLGTFLPFLSSILSTSLMPGQKGGSVRLQYTRHRIRYGRCSQQLEVGQIPPPKQGCSDPDGNLTKTSLYQHTAALRSATKAGLNSPEIRMGFSPGRGPGGPLCPTAIQRWGIDSDAQH